MPNAEGSPDPVFAQLSMLWTPERHEGSAAAHFGDGIALIEYVVRSLHD